MTSTWSEQATYLVRSAMVLRPRLGEARSLRENPFPQHFAPITGKAGKRSPCAATCCFSTDRRKHQLPAYHWVLQPFLPAASRPACQPPCLYLSRSGPDPVWT